MQGRPGCISVGSREADGKQARIPEEEWRALRRRVLGGLRFATIGLLQRSQEAFLDGFTGVGETVSPGGKFRVSSMKLICLDNF